MNKFAVFDIETDGLDYTKIHCLSYSIVGREGVFTIKEHSEIRDFFNEYDYYVGHNIVRFDIPAIRRLVGVDVPLSKLIDTLALSWWYFPSRGQHGLEAWGNEVGVEKVEIEDWEGLTFEDYRLRCEYDVKINLEVFRIMTHKIRSIYTNNIDIKRAMWYASFKMYCLNLQEEYKVSLDIEKAEKELNDMTFLIEEANEQLISAMPVVPKMKVYTRPTNPFKKDGTLSVAGERWLMAVGLTSRDLSDPGPIELPVEGKESPGNPNSHTQMKNWFFSLGWKPQTFKYNDKGEAVPQINGSDGLLCESVVKLAEIEPAIKVLEGLSVLKHRATMIEGFLRDQRNGYIEASAHGFTNTLRLRHKNLVNLPGVTNTHRPEEVKVDWGDGALIRGLLVARKGYEFCGSDITSLEDSTKQHYMFPHDPGYVREMQDPGFDPHLDITKLAGFLTEEQVLAHKNKEADYSSERHKGKTVNFSSVYGVGATTLSRNSGMPIEEAEKLLDVYWKRNWAVKKVADEQIVKTVGDEMWLLNPVSKFWYSLRYRKDIFSTLNQGTGVYVFDTWLKHILRRRPQLSMQFHDEFVLEIREGNREFCDEFLQDAMDDVNKELKLNVEIKFDTAYGKTYADVH